MNTLQSLRHIGARLQALRHDQSLTLEQLARDSGLSTGYLSQIENGSAVPSLTALQLIAAALGTDASEFFPEERRHGTLLTRRGERPTFKIEPTSGEEYAVLAGQVRDRAFSALYARHPPGRSDNARPFRHLGEEFALVLSGRLRVTIDGEAHELGPGDWIHYSSHPTHSVEVVSDEPVEALWLLTPAVV